MKKKYILMGVAAALITTTIVGGSLAYFQADGSNVQQQINTKTLSIALTGSSGSDAAGSVYLDGAMPGDTVTKSVKIENTADTPLYARATIRKYWGSYEKSSDTLSKDFEKDTSRITVETLNNWYVSEEGDEDETIVLYYQDPIQPGESVDLMETLKIAADLDNSYTDLGIGLDVEVDAVQAFAAQEAMLSEWGVWAEIDGGHITSVEE
ncbi:MAG: TasA family protein [Lacrimispora saccharolytica]